MTEQVSPNPVILPVGKNADSSETRVHHPYSPSTLQNLEWCPPYIGRQAETPHVRTTAGTRAHGVTESGADDHRLSDEDSVAAAECLDFVEQRRQLMTEWGIRDQTEAEVKLGRPAPHAFFSVAELKEVYLPVDDLEFPDCKSTTAGYFDRVLISYDQRYAEGFDWKFGFWPVEHPKENLQVIAYTLGLFKRYPRLENVRFWIKQPLIEYVKDAVFTRDEIPALYLRVQVVVARAREARIEARTEGKFPTARPAMPICTFCANLGKCPKVALLMCKVGRKFHPLEIPEDISPTKLLAPEAASLGLRLAAVAKAWAEAFRRQTTDRIICGEMELPPGQKLQTMSKREIVDLPKLRTIALKYLTNAEFESTLETTFGGLETIIQDKAPRGQKKAMVQEFQSALEESGAVRRGEEFSFLRAIAVKE